MTSEQLKELSALSRSLEATQQAISRYEDAHEEIESREIKVVFTSNNNAKVMTGCNHDIIRITSEPLVAMLRSMISMIAEKQWDILCDTLNSTNVSIEKNAE